MSRVIYRPLEGEEVITFGDVFANYDPNLGHKELLTRKRDKRNKARISQIAFKVGKIAAEALSATNKAKGHKAWRPIYIIDCEVPIAEPMIKERKIEMDL